LKKFRLPHQRLLPAGKFHSATIWANGLFFLMAGCNQLGWEDEAFNIPSAIEPLSGQ